MADKKYTSYYTNRDDSVYVSNIDYACSHQDVKDLFQKVGTVAFVEMLKDKNNRPNGCAVVRFKDSDIVDKAMDNLNRYEYKGRNIVVKSARDVPHGRQQLSSSERPGRDRKRPRDDDFGIREPASKHGNTHGLSVPFLESIGIDGPLNNRVFVANLPYDALEDDIKDVFSICGKVEDVELVHRSTDGKSKGFGFVEFEHPIEAVQAISMLHNQPYHNRLLSVQYTQKETRKNNPGPKLPSGLMSIGMGLGLNGAPLKDVARTVEAGQQQSLLGAIPLSSSNIAPINLMGMPSPGSRNYSRTLGGDIHSGTSQLMSSNLREKLLTGSGLLDTPAAMSFVNNRSIRDSNIGSSLMGTRNCIQVSNLPPDYTWKALYDLCQTFGEVNFAKMSGIGVGGVHFESDSAARMAIEMLDRQELEGRFLSAKFM